MTAFEVTQDYVVALNNNWLFLWDATTAQQLWWADAGTPAAALVNPYYPLVVVLGATQAQTWALSRGELRLRPAAAPTEERTTTLSAKALDGSRCASTLAYQVLNGSNFSVVSLGASPLPSHISDFEAHLTVGGVVSGPNLHYEASAVGSVTSFMAHQLWGLQLSAANGFPNATDVVFVEVLAMDDPLEFVYVAQTSNSTVHIWTCSSGGLLEHAQACEKLGVIEAKRTLTFATFQAWLFQDQVTVAVLDGDRIVTIYTCDDDDACTVMMKHEWATDAAAVTGFLFTQRHLWVLRGASVDILRLDSSGLVVVKEVSADTLAEQGCASWKPRKLYGNRELNPSLVFVDNSDSLLLLDFHSDLTLVAVVPYSLAGDASLAVDVAVARSTFFLLQRTDGNQSVAEYSYADLSDVHALKSLNMLWYRL